MSVPTSIPRPNGRSCLNNSDLIPNREHTHAQKLYNSFTGTVGQVVPQNPTGPESRPELSGTDDSTPHLTQQSSTRWDSLQKSRN